MLKLNDVELTGKSVLIREDFNVPLSFDEIQDDTRIRRALPTIEFVLAQGASQIILVSHLGQPEAGAFDSDFSLKSVAAWLSEALNEKVALVSDWQQSALPQNKIILLENTRFCVGETENDMALSKQLAALADIVVFDAFSVSHRTHASTCGLIEQAEVACMGLLLEKELDALTYAEQQSEKPVVAIIGGAKISTKLGLLKVLTQKVDYLIPGGGIANTLLKAAGYAVGDSLYENACVASAEILLQQEDCEILLPEDVVVSENLTQPGRTTSIRSIQKLDKIFDIGDKTISNYKSVIETAKTIIWNGPLGVFEYAHFAKGTDAIADAVASSSAYTLVGGGDTLAALQQCDQLKNMRYASTGGGALLAYLEGKPLAALEALRIKK